MPECMYCVALKILYKIGRWHQLNVCVLLNCWVSAMSRSIPLAIAGPFQTIQMKNIKSKGSREKRKKNYTQSNSSSNNNIKKTASIATWIRRNENRVNPKLRHEKMCIRVHFQCGFSGFFLFYTPCTRRHTHRCVHKYAICKRDVRSNNI